MIPKLKKRISIDVDVELTGDELLKLLENADTFTQCAAINRLAKALSDTQLQLLIKSFPEAAKLFLGSLQEFVTRMDKIRDEVDIEAS